MRRTYPRGLMAAVVAIGIAATPADGAELRLTGKEVPGLRPASGKGAALKALGGKPSRAVKRAPRRGAVFAAGKRRLTVGLFTLRSTAAAKRVAPARRVRTLMTGGKAHAIVTLRVGTVVAAVRYELPGRSTKRASQVARAFASLQAGKLRRLLFRTAWRRTLDETRRDGSVSTGTALRAFALAYGPLPGVKTPSGRRGVSRSGTLAIRMIARRWSSLTTAQRAAVDRVLGARRGGPLKSAPRARAADGTLTPAPDYQAIVDKHAAFFKSKLPGAANVPIKVYRYSEEIEHANDPTAVIWGDALHVNANGEWGEGAITSCRIRIAPAGQGAESDPYFEVLLAHETFHCIEFALMPAWSDRPDWLLEGMADWAAIAATAAPLAIASGSYREYLEAPDAPLFARAYDAIGFWGRAHELGGLWGKIPAVLNAPTNEASFAAAGATQQAFVDTWASATFRFPFAGDAWYQQNPYGVPYETVPSPLTPVVDDATLASDAYGLRQYAVLMEDERPLVRVDGKAGSLRAGSPKEDFGKVTSQWYCHGACACPPEADGTIPPHQKITDGLFLGLTGGAAPGSGNVTFHALDEFCKTATGVTVSGATQYTISQRAFCVPTPGGLRVEIAWNEGGQKQAHITIELAGYKGKGGYGPEATTVTAYDYRSSAPQHQWGPGPGSATVTDPGSAAAFGAEGTVSATLQTPGVTPPSVVEVKGRWSCTRNDAA